MPSELTVEAKGVLCDLALPPDEGFHLVAHSYGAAVALQMAILQPRRVRSLTLYEPAAFGLLLADGPTDLAWEEIADVAARLTLELRAGDDLQAARGFCAYWHGRDIWHQLYLSQKVRLARAMPTVERHFQALFSANWDEAQLSRVRAPVLLICGEHTRNSARRVALNLAARLPLVQLKVLADADHMTPLTDAARVNAVVLDALQRQPQPSRTSPADLDFRKTLR
jgi:pimeloyl-ACP methyl ester carboxylesterase